MGLRRTRVTDKDWGLNLEALLPCGGGSGKQTVHKSIWIKKCLVNPRCTVNQSSNPCTVLQYPSRKAAILYKTYLRYFATDVGFVICILASQPTWLSVLQPAATNHDTWGATRCNIWQATRCNIGHVHAATHCITWQMHAATRCNIWHTHTSIAVRIIASREAQLNVLQLMDDRYIFIYRRVYYINVYYISCTYTWHTKRAVVEYIAAHIWQVHTSICVSHIVYIYMAIS